jgi:fructokinase
MVAAPSGLNPAVLSMGEILIDFIVADGATSLESAEAFLARPGGAPANAAVALARLGVPSAFCGVAGDDPFGIRLQQTLMAESVDTSHLRLSDHGATTLAFAWQDARGDGHFWLLRGADTLLSPQDAETAVSPELAALIVGSVALAAEPSRDAIVAAVARARQLRIPVVFDVNLRPTLWPEQTVARGLSEEITRQSQVVKLSLDDAEGLFGVGTTPESAIEQLLGLGPPCVVLTDGERGCWFAGQRCAIGYVPAFAVDAIEPTGAGDAFGAALIAKSIESNWAPPTVADVRYAAAAGALATTRRGAWDGLPTRAQLAAFLAKR